MSSEAGLHANQKKILVVEDDDHFRKMLEMSLIRYHYTPQTCRNGQEAQSLIHANEFDWVISDIRMPKMTGIELLHWIRLNRPSLPVILMTGFSEISETHEAVQLGASGFIAKPFKVEDLLNSISSCSKTEKHEESQKDLDNEFCWISIEDFTLGRQLNFGIYVRLKNTKYVKIAHKGEDLDADRIESFNKKNILGFYAKIEDFIKFLKFDRALATPIAATEEGSQNERIRLLQNQAASTLQEFRLLGFRETEYVRAEGFVQNCLKVIGKSPEMTEWLWLLAKDHAPIYSQSLGTSMVSLIIGRLLGSTDFQTLYNLALGSLLDPLRVNEVRDEIQKKSTKPLPTDFGTPIEDSMINLVRIATDFCRLTMVSQNSPILPPREALLKMEREVKVNYDPSCLSTMKNLFS